MARKRRSSRASGDSEAAFVNPARTRGTGSVTRPSIPARDKICNTASSEQASDFLFQLTSRVFRQVATADDNSHALAGELAWFLQASRERHTGRALYQPSFSVSE